MVLRTVGALVAVALTAAPAGSTGGISFAVDPVTFTLIPPVRNATVTLTNLSNDPLRLQVSVSAWTQSDTGALQLAPTSGAIVFPQLFTLPPLGAQRLRAAVVAPVSATEQTFRIVVTDLPSLAETVGAARGAPSISVRTRFLVPVYVEPAVRTRAAHFEGATMRDGQLRFVLMNTGTVHVEGLTLPLEIHDATGATVFSADAGRWNVLAGGRRIFTVDTGKLRCAPGRTLALAPGGGMVPAQTVTIGACT